MLQKFVIKSSDINGPLNLRLTINSGQTSQPAWEGGAGRYKELIKVKGNLCYVTIECPENYSNSLKVEIHSKNEISKKILKNVISEIFSLDYDLNRFYEFLREDPLLAPSIEFCNGLRVFKAQDPFECIISSISSANCSIVRWTRSIKDIKSKWGDKYKYKSDTLYSFPSPLILSKAPEHDLEEMQREEDNLPDNYIFKKNLQACGVGYRAKYIIQTAKIINEEFDLGEISKMNYDQAFKKILELPGVGPKVADCILLYGFGKLEAFPVDVWIKRIMEHFYFSGEERKAHEIRDYGMERFGNFAGYVQLYLFHFARKSGLLAKISK
jgi:N-glycosylase/DNA lyase